MLEISVSPICLALMCLVARPSVVYQSTVPSSISTLGSPKANTEIATEAVANIAIANIFDADGKPKVAMTATLRDSQVLRKGMVTRNTREYTTLRYPKKEV